jgi:integrase
MFKKAIRNGLASLNPCEDVSKPKATNGTHRALTEQERRVFLSVCETNPYGLWALTMYYCGLRPGETALLQWFDADLNKGVLHVRGTKTKAADRYVPIPAKLAQRLSQAPGEPFDFMFTNGDGRKLAKHNRKRYWQSIVKDMHVAMGGKTDYGELKRMKPPYMVADDLVPYCLRHDYATRLQAAGVPINVAKELLGHTTIEMTARIYTHASVESFENARSMIDIFESNSESRKKAAVPCVTA